MLGSGVLTVMTDGMFVSEGGDIDITPTPHYPLIGLRLMSAAGLNITRGFMNVTSGGLVSLYDGIAIHNNGLHIDNGLYVYSGGMTVTTDGLYVSAGNVSITAGGLVTVRRGQCHSGDSSL